MADDDKNMPTDGSMTRSEGGAEVTDRCDNDNRADGANPGNSGGGACANRHGGKDKGGFHGAQSVMGYQSSGQLGSEDFGDNDNAPAAAG